MASSLRFISSLLLLEMESRRELYPPRRPGGDRLAEKRRAQSSDEPRVVHPIDDVERVDADRPRRSVLSFARSDRKLVRPAQIDQSGAPPLDPLPPHTRRP